MKQKPQFQLQNAVLLMALAAAYPLSATAAVSAGVAQFTVGEVNVRRADGKTDTLVKGKDIESGQAIVTGPTGRAQVKFSDGGLVSLQPNTEFKIANYVDQANPKEDRFLVDLLRGSMRAITGLIGKRNRENYKVTTQTATIGIRGSGFNAGYNPDGTLGVTTEFDGIEVCNAAGCVGLTAGESVVVVSNQTLPVRTNTRADVPTPQTKQDPVTVGNQADDSGKNKILDAVIIAATDKKTDTPTRVTPKLLSGVALTSIGLTATGYDQRNSINGALQIGEGTDATIPTRYIADSASVGTGTKTGNATVIATSGSLQTGDYVVVGTWDGSSWVANQDTTTATSTAFAAGVPAPTTALAALSGQRATYSLKDATPVFASTGGSGTLLSTSRINVDFTAQSGNYADIKLDISMPSNVGYNLRGGILGTGAGFSGALAVSGSGCTMDGGFCGFGTVAGSFSGTNAQYTLISYGGYGQSTGVFGGAASFVNTSQALTPSSIVQTGMVAVLMDGSGTLGSYGASYGKSGTLTPSFTGEKLQGVFDNQSYYGGTGGNTTPGGGTVLASVQYTASSIVNNTPATGTFAALGNISDADFLGWGNWVQATSQTRDSYNNVTSSDVLNSVHYLVGRPTPNLDMPISGTSSYSLVGSTAPTATLNGVTQTGQLISASLNADFYAGSVQAAIATKFGATAVNINQNASFARGSAGFSGSSGPSYSGTSVNGFFTGTMASRAGLVYSTTQTQIGNVTGALAFQRSSASGLVQNTGVVTTGGY